MHARFQTYDSFIKKHLNAADGDPSFYYKTEKDSKELQGILAVYVDDTPASGNKKIFQLINKISETF